MLKYLEIIKDEFLLEEKSANVLYGRARGFEVTIYSVVSSNEGITLIMNFYGDDELKNKVAKEFLNFEGGSFAKASITTFGIRCSVNGWTSNGASKKFIAKLNHAIDVLVESGANGNLCPLCGEDVTEKTPVLVNDVYITLDEECEKKFEEAINKSEEEYANQPNNYLKGTMGALIGVIVGVVAWIILYLIGFFSAIVPILTVYLADLLYVKFGGKSNIVKIVIVSVMTLVSMLLVCLGLYVFVGEALAMEYGFNGTGFEYIMSNPELKEAFTYDMIMNGVFTLIGIGIQAFSILRKNNSERLKISK